MANILKQIDEAKALGAPDSIIQRELLKSLATKTKKALEFGADVNTISNAINLNEITAKYPNYGEIINNTITGLDRIQPKQEPIEQPQNDPANIASGDVAPSDTSDLFTSAFSAMSSVVSGTIDSIKQQGLIPDSIERFVGSFLPNSARRDPIESWKKDIVPIIDSIVETPEYDTAVTVGTLALLGYMGGKILYDIPTIRHFLITKKELVKINKGELLDALKTVTGGGSANPRQVEIVRSFNNARERLGMSAQDMIKKGIVDVHWVPRFGKAVASGANLPPAGLITETPESATFAARQQSATDLARAVQEIGIKKTGQSLLPTTAALPYRPIPLTQAQFNVKYPTSESLLEDLQSGSITLEEINNLRQVKLTPKARAAIKKAEKSPLVETLKFKSTIEAPLQKQVLDMETTEENVQVPAIQKTVDIENIPEVKVDKGIISDILEDNTGEVAVVNAFDPISRIGKVVHDFIWAFGEAKRLDPALYDKAMSTFARKNAGIERAIDQVKKVVGTELISVDDDVKMAMIYEQKGLAPPPHLKDIYDGFANLNNMVEDLSLKEGIFQQTFQDRMIAVNNGKIKDLQIKKATPKNVSKIEELMAENAYIESIRYLPHKSVARKVIESKLNELGRDEKMTFIRRSGELSSRHKERKGKMLLADYIEKGIIKPEDVRLSKLTMENLIDYYRRSAIHSLHDFAKARGLVKPASDELLKNGWYRANELGLTIPEFKGMMISPIYKSVLDEFSAMRSRGEAGIFRLGRNILGMVKVGQFIKPTIIWTYNGLQKNIFAGAYLFNPVKEIRLLGKAYRAAMTKNEDYHELNALNTFQFPSETPRSSIEEQVEAAVRAITKEIPGYVKLIEKAIGKPFTREFFDIQDVVMSGYRAIANVTWLGDKVQRIHTVYVLEEMGYDRDEAAAIAARAHGSYSELSTQYKRILSPIFFVHSFRILMPREMIKVISEPMAAVIEQGKGGKKVNPRDAKRWAKKIASILIIPTAISAFLKARGWQKEKALWKWKKKVVDEIGKESEVVLGLNTIYNMPAKWFHRAVHYNPIKPKNRLFAAVENVFKYELHPVSRIVMDIAENSKSFGQGEVYDPNRSGVGGGMAQLKQAFGYAMANSFKLYGKMYEHRDILSRSERRETERIAKLAMGGIGAIFAKTFGYFYTRENLPVRKALMLNTLERELTKRTIRIAQQYSPNVADTDKEIKRKEVAREEKLDYLREWADFSVKWIQEEYR